MFKRFCTSLSAALAVAAFVTSVVGHAQTASAPLASTATSVVVSAWHAQFSKGWTPPKTAWGDPDLQGNFTWVDEVDRPLERPDKFEGRSLTSITQAELNAINIGSQFEAVQGDPGGTGGGATAHWYEGGDQYKHNSTAWGVLEPVDGKRPPYTPEAARIVAATPRAI